MPSLCRREYAPNCIFVCFLSFACISSIWGGKNTTMICLSVDRNAMQRSSISSIG